MTDELLVLQVKQAVEKFAARCIRDGGIVDLTNANYDDLTSDIIAEWMTGQDGSAYEVLVDLHDSVGLLEYGIVIS